MDPELKKLVVYIIIGGEGFLQINQTTYRLTANIPPWGTNKFYSLPPIRHRLLQF